MSSRAPPRPKRPRLPIAGRDDVAERLVTGLSKIALALKHRATAEAAPHGVSPTQAQILLMLRGSPGEVRLADVARSLAITAPTASDAIRSLEEKGLVEKRRSRADARALELRLTRDGARLADSAAEWPDFLLRAVGELSEGEQEVFLVGLVKMIRALQERGEIPIARMCVTCTHFRPHAHEDPREPHHCTFVDAAFGARDLRLDCVDHVASPPDKQAGDWLRFTAH